MNAICNLPKDPGGTHRLLLRSINSNRNQLSAPAWRPGPWGAFLTVTEEQAASFSSSGVGIPGPQLPTQPQVCPGAHHPREAFGFITHRVHLTALVSRARGDGSGASWAGATGWSEASSPPRVGSSPQPPSRRFPSGLTINPSPRGRASPILLLDETRGPLVMNSGGPREREAERGLLRSRVWETLLEPGEPPRENQQELGVGGGERSDHKTCQR